MENRIQAARGAMGLSRPQAAKLAGIPYSTIQKAELGYTTPTQKTIAKIAAALGVKPEELLAKEGRANG